MFLIFIRKTVKFPILKFQTQEVFLKFASLKLRDKKYKYINKNKNIILNKYLQWLKHCNI